MGRMHVYSKQASTHKVEECQSGSSHLSPSFRQYGDTNVGAHSIGQRLPRRLNCLSCIDCPKTKSEILFITTWLRNYQSCHMCTLLWDVRVYQERSDGKCKRNEKGAAGHVRSNEETNILHPNKIPAVSLSISSRSGRVPPLASYQKCTC